MVLENTKTKTHLQYTFHIGIYSAVSYMKYEIMDISQIFQKSMAFNRSQKLRI